MLNDLLNYKLQADTSHLLPPIFRRRSKINEEFGVLKGMITASLFYATVLSGQVCLGWVEDVTSMT
jgi:hypothetical protein